MPARSARKGVRAVHSGHLISTGNLVSRRGSPCISARLPLASIDNGLGASSSGGTKCWLNCSIGQQENGNVNYTSIRCFVDAVRDGDSDSDSDDDDGDV